MSVDFTCNRGAPLRVIFTWWSREKDITTVFDAFTSRCQVRSHRAAALTDACRFSSERLDNLWLDINAVSSANWLQLTSANEQESGRSMV